MAFQRREREPENQSANCPQNAEDQKGSGKEKNFGHRTTLDFIAQMTTLYR